MQRVCGSPWLRPAYVPRFAQTTHALHIVAMTQVPKKVDRVVHHVIHHFSVTDHVIARPHSRKCTNFKCRRGTAA